jgi:hypothetical protein
MQNMLKYSLLISFILPVLDLFDICFFLFALINNKIIININI